MPQVSGEKSRIQTTLATRLDPTVCTREKLRLEVGAVNGFSLVPSWQGSCYHKNSTSDTFHPTPTHPGLEAQGNLGFSQGQTLPGAQGQWQMRLELLYKETHLLRSRLRQSCLEKERTPVSAQHWPSPASLLLSQWEGFPGVGWDHRGQQPCVALSGFTKKSDFAGIRGGWTRVQNSVMLQSGRGTCLEKVLCCSLNLTHFGII